MTTTTVTLRLSGDRKVSSSVRVQPSKQQPLLHNSFGLPAGKSCPGETPFCIGCYAARTEKVFTSAGRLVEANYEALLACNDDVASMITLLDDGMDVYRKQFIKLYRAGRVELDDDIFRIHWDGDFFSENYTRAWREVAIRNLQTQFWTYTRSFKWVHHLLNVPNLAVYLSVDQYNWSEARDLIDKHPSLRVALCADTQADAKVLADKLSRKAAPCPENIGRIPLVMHKSGRRTIPVESNTDAKGACAACRLCVDGVRDVAFAINKR